VVLLLFMRQLSREIPVNEGAGWDGADYAAILRGDYSTATANTALRPLIVAANRPAYAVFGSAIRAFRAMNLVYTAVLCFTLCALFDRYNRDQRLKALLVGNLFLCVALVKFVAFYPILVDLGAYAVMTIALYAIVTERRLVSAPATVAAVLAREFGIATVLFGVVRDLRRRVSLWVVFATYAPAMAALFVLRALVAQRWPGDEGAVTFAGLIANLELWRDPVFAALFLYFAVTVFGGVSLFVVARGGLAARHLIKEPEWAAFSALIVAAAAAGDADIWRYLAYLLPAAVVLFAVCGLDLGAPRRFVVVAILVCVTTIVTQRPLQHMDLPSYFRDWFPYYIQRGGVRSEPILQLWPLWGWRLITAAGLLWLMSAVASRTTIIEPARHTGTL
jgi:hypothetical protein